LEIRTRRVGQGTYHYLVHSYRVDGRVRKIEKYLGRRVPSNINDIRMELLAKLVELQFGRTLKRVHAEYMHQVQRTPPSIRLKNLEAFAVGFTYESNRIEGSTLKRRETRSLLVDGITPQGRPLQDVQESLAHREVFLRALKEPGPLKLEKLLDWHAHLFRLTKPEIAGNIRNYSVRVAQSRFEPPVAVELEPLLREFFDSLAVTRRKLNPVQLAGWVHLRLVTIHPFGDGNGRITRIAMNRELYRAGYPMLSIPYGRRHAYYDALERSQMRKDDTPFIHWFLRQYVRAVSRVTAY
jgi:Fic family protein